METTDPRALLGMINLDELKHLLDGGRTEARVQSINYVHPASETISPTTSQAEPVQANGQDEPGSGLVSPTIHGMVQKLGDFIDTDALAPAEILTPGVTKEQMADACLKYTHPGFRRLVQAGYNIIVAGDAFGVGSSRENAVSALQATGVQAVIAKSFAFIYGRNQPNLGMLGFVVTDEEFHLLAQDGEPIAIDTQNRKVTVAGHEFSFQLSDLEWQLVRMGGITNAFRRWGRGVLEAVTGQQGSTKTVPGSLDEAPATSKPLQW